jgi:hypothetical protein
VSWTAGVSPGNLALAGDTPAVHTGAMRTLIILAALVFAPAAEAQTLAQLDWLKGCWRTAAPAEAETGAVVTEVWVAPPMPAMLGYAYTVGEGQVQGWEQTRIEMIDGWPHFVAMPSGAAPVLFRLLDPSETIHLDDIPDGFAIFENPAHDYPQRVSYARYGNRLLANISDIDGGNRVEFEYRRVRCAAGLRP